MRIPRAFQSYFLVMLIIKENNYYTHYMLHVAVAPRHDLGPSSKCQPVGKSSSTSVSAKILSELRMSSSNLEEEDDGRLSGGVSDVCLFLLLSLVYLRYIREPTTTTITVDVPIIIPLAALYSTIRPQSFSTMLQRVNICFSLTCLQIDPMVWRL